MSTLSTDLTNDSPANPLGEGWDHETSPRGPSRRWTPEDPIDMPDDSGKYPSWRTIRERAWRSMAQRELDAREAGKAHGDKTLLEVHPLANMTEAQLPETSKTGKAPDGFEIEHQYVPQRVTRLLIAAGIPDSEVARLGRLGDPTNLYPTRKEIHAGLDEEAAKFTNPNPTLPAALDDRTEFPLGSLDIESLIEAIEGDERVDLDATPAGQELRHLLTIENARRGGRWKIP